ncbi:MAG TPA: hypothetical protein VIH42_13545 [Thermoguttaceae bacterium]
MNDNFEKRIRAAAVAGWWMLLIAACFLAIQWIAYLIIMGTKPEWVRSMWGPELSWSYVQNAWFWMAAIFKLCIWVMAMLVIWLTLWARQLRKIK